MVQRAHIFSLATAKGGSALGSLHIAYAPVKLKIEIFSIHPFWKAQHMQACVALIHLVASLQAIWLSAVFLLNPLALEVVLQNNVLS